MNFNDLKREWKVYEEVQFEGWDFSYIKDSWENEVLPWDYAEIVKGYLNPDLQLLDMRTGGGEILLSLNHPYENTAVTEGWKPNVELLKDKLVPLGIKLAVVDETDIMDFKDNSFDMIINRHGSFRVEEVMRVLKTDGLFITQQVGNKDGNRLSNMIIPDYTPKSDGLNVKRATERFRDAHFDILFLEEYYPYQKFFSMEALIYYVKVIEWEYPGFSVESHFEQLLQIYHGLTRDGYVLNDAHRFIIVARNKK